MHQSDPCGDFFTKTEVSLCGGKGPFFELILLALETPDRELAKRNEVKLADAYFFFLGLSHPLVDDAFRLANVEVVPLAEGGKPQNVFGFSVLDCPC